MMKSLLVNVFWPMWEWGPKKMASMRYLSAAHMQTLSIRDNEKAGRLLKAEWFQDRWPIQLLTDRSTKISNTDTGFREAMAFGSMTGSRGHRVLIDDPLSVDSGNSDADLLSAERTITESVPTRISNEETSAIIVIMQRVHERDTSGVILAKNMGYTHLMLPMRFESDRRCVTSIGFSDPRTVEGELLFPERFPLASVEEKEKIMGSYATAGQMQQRPAPRDGGMFKRHWFNPVNAVPVGTRFVRGWDQAASEGDGDYTAGVKIGKTPEGRFIVADVVREQYGPAKVERLIKNTTAQDGYACKVSLPQDPGSAGKVVASIQVGKLAGFNAQASPETGSKQLRAQPLAAQAEAGNVDMLVATWNEVFLDEICNFPNAKYDDQVDGASRAFNTLATEIFFDLEAMT